MSYPPGQSIKLCYLHSTTVHADFMNGVLDALFYDMANHKLMAQPGGILHGPSGPNVAAPRNSLAMDFLDTGADWMLMLDTDIAFPPFLPLQMLASARKYEATVLSALYWGLRRDERGKPVAFPVAFDAPAEPGQDLVPADVSDRVARPVAAVGAGALLVHRQALTDVLAAQEEGPLPFFAETVRDGILNSEDIEFCLRLAEAGHTAWLDPAIEVAHLKTLPIHSSITDVPLLPPPAPSPSG